MSALGLCHGSRVAWTQETKNKLACFAAYLIVTVTASVQSRRPAPFISHHFHRVLLQPSYETPHQAKLDQPPGKQHHVPETLLHARHSRTAAPTDVTSRPPVEAAASSASTGRGRWFRDLDRSRAGRRLSDWPASDLMAQRSKWQKKNRTKWESPVVSNTVLGDVAEALLLNGLVIYEVLNLRGGAVHVGVLQYKSTWQPAPLTPLILLN